jgi:hypothetical protein
MFTVHAEPLPPAPGRTKELRMKSLLTKSRVTKSGVTQSLAALVLAGAGCSSAPVGDAQPRAERVGRASAAVESDYRWGSFEYLFHEDEASVSIASLEVPARDAAGAQMVVDGVPIRYTCGLTFVSAHYAITAAHCIELGSVPDPANATFPVSTYDISGVSWDNLVAAQNLRGSFPAYSHKMLTAADGYKQKTLTQCHVIHRCGSTWGPYNCDMEADVALIKCDDRSPFGPYMDVAESDDGQGDVEVRWYHEVFAVSRQRPTPPVHPDNPLEQAIYDALLDKWDHYANHPGGPESNYHYFATNQLMPLVSSPWYVGDLVFPRRRLGPGTGFDSTYMWTDLFGCHGTSGAGVTQIGTSGRHELLGPTSKVGDTWDSRLCADPIAARPGQKLMGYTRLPYVRALYQTALNDPGEYWMYGKPAP